MGEVNNKESQIKDRMNYIIFARKLKKVTYKSMIKRLINVILIIGIHVSSVRVI